MLMAFLLVVVVDNNVVSDDSMFFRDIYQCNKFSRAIEQQETLASGRNYYRQEKVTAYCIPKIVNKGNVFYDQRRTDNFN